VSVRKTFSSPKSFDCSLESTFVFTAGTLGFPVREVRFFIGIPVIFWSTRFALL